MLENVPHGEHTVRPATNAVARRQTERTPERHGKKTPIEHQRPGICTVETVSTGMREKQRHKRQPAATYEPAIDFVNVLLVHTHLSMPQSIKGGLMHCRIRSRYNVGFAMS